jgi:hypothetical protein
MVKRPGIVTFVGVVILLQSFLNLVAGVVLLAFRDDVQSYLAENGADLSDGAATGSAIGSFIAALLLLVVGAGILRGSRGWRLFVVIVEGFNMAVALFLMIAHPHGSYFSQGIVTLLVGFFVIWALYGHDKSEAYFEST